MLFCRQTCTTSALIALLAAPLPATADITSDDVWTGLTAFYGAFGITLTATKTRTGNSLTLTDMKATAAFPFEAGSATLTTAGFTLIDTPDGTVTFSMPASVPVAFAVRIDDKITTGTLSYDQAGYTMRASGTPEAIKFKYGVDTLTLSLTDIQLPETTATEKTTPEIFASMKFKDFSNKSALQLGTQISFSQQASGGTMELAFGFALPEGNSQLQASIVSASNNYTTDMRLPLGGFTMATLPNSLRDGLSFAATSDTSGYSSETITTESGGVIIRQTDTYAESTSSAALSKTGLSFEAQITEHSFSGRTPDLAQPLDLGVATTNIALQMPVLASPEPQSAALSFDILGLTSGGALWDIFDPAKALPRDAANLSFDVETKLRLFKDIFDTATILRVIDGTSSLGEIDSLTINGISLTALGAAFNATGAFTFEYDDKNTATALPTTFPTATGRADIQMSGANGLIDTLTQMGLLQDNDAMTARMAMGVFMTPGTAEDSLTSTLEVTPDGQISANGQRLK